MYYFVGSFRSPRWWLVLVALFRLVDGWVVMVKGLNQLVLPSSLHPHAPIDKAIAGLER